MALCATTQALSSFPKCYNHTVLTTNPTCLRPSLPLRPTPLSRTAVGLHSRLLFTSSLARATTSEESSGGANLYAGEERDGVVTLEDASPGEMIFGGTVVAEVPEEESPGDEQTQSFELLDKLNIKFDSDDAYNILLYGGGALVAVWFSSVIVRSIDSIPLFPKLMEVVGLGYTFWFSYRYLIFKKNRDELATKIEELKQQVLGSNDDY
ncbi:protein CURVATURE THYLAKOID 1D, chloroplastic isoform X2 [Alnus glutinosa]|uniref:protein CURVATURE THYLAKOID 1D, chloroplastic isoform X2 n=1 Tax=Alnus glutinosa TaxID=3517 RepID=UPI002D77B8D8|nr:protein CURVATURE THYLAKOID 1D, chloroplastic isoform X2 [Alnus glutinosa]